MLDEVLDTPEPHLIGLVKNREQDQLDSDVGMTDWRAEDVCCGGGGGRGMALAPCAGEAAQSATGTKQLIRMAGAPRSRSAVYCSWRRSRRTTTPAL